VGHRGMVMRAGAIGVVEIGNATLNGELVLDSSDNHSKERHV